MRSDAVRVYTDGACKGNPGPGGFGVRIRYPDGRVQEFGGREASTTNNRMEMQAVIEGLGRVPDEKKVLVVVDSQYVLLGVTQWMDAWKKRGWLTRDKRPVMNQDLWKALDVLLRPGVSFAYTAGHAGDPDNERCDLIASRFAENKAVALIDGMDTTPIAPLKAKPPRKRPAAGGGHGPAVYLSFVDGSLKRHATWAECEIEVKGRSGALFKKCRSLEEESETLKKWGLPS